MTDKMRSIVLRTAEVRDLVEKGEAPVVRPVKPQPWPDWQPASMGEIHKMDEWGFVMRKGEPIVIGWGACDADGEAGYVCPFGAPGSELWVRETWGCFDGLPSDVFNPEYGVCYCADEIEVGAAEAHWRVAPMGWEPSQMERWMSPVTMPRWASRLTVRVEEVNVELIDGVWNWGAGLKRLEPDGKEGQ